MTFYVWSKLVWGHKDSESGRIFKICPQVSEQKWNDASKVETGPPQMPPNRVYVFWGALRGPQAPQYGYVGIGSSGWGTQWRGQIRASSQTQFWGLTAATFDVSLQVYSVISRNQLLNCNLYESWGYGATFRVFSRMMSCRIWLIPCLNSKNRYKNDPLLL